MKAIITLFLSLFVFSAHAVWDSSVLIGEWENYRYGYSHSYQKLIINSDYSGSYSYISDKGVNSKMEISKKDFQFFNGFAVLNIENNFKFLLSAWGASVTGNSKRILGQLFIYINEGDELKLINSEPMSLYSSVEQGFLEFANKVKNLQVQNQ